MDLCLLGCPPDDRVVTPLVKNTFRKSASSGVRITVLRAIQRYNAREG